MGCFADLYSQIQKTVGATARVRELLLEEPEPVVPPVATAARRTTRPLLAPDGAAATPCRAPPLATAQPAARRGGVRACEFQLIPRGRRCTVLRDLSLRGAAGRTRRAGRPERRGQIDARLAAAALLRARQRGRSCSTAGPRADYPLARSARADGHRAAGSAALRRHDRREHRLRQARARATRRSPPPRGRPTRTTSSRSSRRATRRWWASAASSSPAASASASPSRGRSSRTRRS